MNRQTGIIITVITAVLCGCPGIFSCFGGLLTAVVSRIPGSTIDIAGSSDPTTALLTGAGGICVGIIFVVIPILAWFFMVRNKPA